MRIALLILFLASAAFGQNTCIQAVSPEKEYAPLTEEQIERNRVLTLESHIAELQITLGISTDKRIDVELTDYFRKLVNPTMKSVSEVLNNKSVLSEGRLSATIARRASKELSVIQGKLTQLGKLTAINKSTYYKALDKIPGSIDARVKAYQADIRDGHFKLLNSLHEIKQEITVLQGVGSKAQSRLTAMNVQLRLLSDLVDFLQKEAWAEEKKGNSLRLKTLKEALRHADTIQNEFIQVQGVAIAFANRIDQAIDVNHQTYQQVQSLLQSEINLIQSVADRELVLTPLLKKPSQLSVIASKWMKFTTNRWTRAKNWFENLNRGVKYTLIGIAVMSGGYQVYDYITPDTASHAHAQKSQIKSSNALYNAENEKAWIEKAESYSDLVENTLKLANAAPNSSVEDEILIEAFKKSDVNLSPHQAVKILKEMNNSSTRNNILKWYLESRMQLMTSETLVEMLQVFSNSSFGSSFVINYVNSFGNSLTYYELKELTNALSASNAINTTVYLYVQANHQKLSEKQFIDVLNLYSSGSYADQALMFFVEKNAQRLTTDEVVELANKASSSSVRAAVVRLKTRAM